jgi:hypothetical protein
MAEIERHTFDFFCCLGSLGFLRNSFDLTMIRTIREEFTRAEVF